MRSVLHRTRSATPDHRPDYVYSSVTNHVLGSMNEPTALGQAFLYLESFKLKEAYNDGFWLRFQEKALGLCTCDGRMQQHLYGMPNVAKSCDDITGTAI